MNHCNICGGGVKQIYKLPFRDLQGTGTKEYIQELYFCETCGFLFTGNPLSEKQLTDRYQNFSKFEFDQDNYILNESDTYKKRCSRQLHFIMEAIGDDFSSVLEVGAASGYNLSLYADKEVMGIEPSAQNCLAARRRYHVQMYQGMFQQFIKENTKSYDLIFLSHTLEHMVNPRDFILQCSRICNAYIFIEVPGMDYKFLDEPMGMFCEEHVNYFTLESLSSLMYSAGFVPVDVNYIFGLYQCLPAGWPAMSTLWKKAEHGAKMPRVPVLRSALLVREYLEKNQELLEKIRKRIDQIPVDKRLAVWGTGHHASMLLANTSLSEKNLVKVYDSDERKYQYTFHGLPICGFDENDIYSKKIDAVLVATYTAQKAICKVLEPFAGICSIYCLYEIP